MVDGHASAAESSRPSAALRVVAVFAVVLWLAATVLWVGTTTLLAWNCLCPLLALWLAAKAHGRALLGMLLFAGIALGGVTVAMVLFPGRQNSTSAVAFVFWPMLQWGAFGLTMAVGAILGSGTATDRVTTLLRWVGSLVALVWIGFAFVWVGGVDGGPLFLWNATPPVATFLYLRFRSRRDAVPPRLALFLVATVLAARTAVLVFTTVRPRYPRPEPYLIWPVWELLALLAAVAVGEVVELALARRRRRHQTEVTLCGARPGFAPHAPGR